MLILACCFLRAFKLLAQRSSSPNSRRREGPRQTSLRLSSHLDSSSRVSLYFYLHFCGSSYNEIMPRGLFELEQSKLTSPPPSLSLSRSRLHHGSLPRSSSSHRDHVRLYPYSSIHPVDLASLHLSLTSFEQLQHSTQSRWSTRPSSLVQDPSLHPLDLPASSSRKGADPHLALLGVESTVVAVHLDSGLDGRSARERVGGDQDGGRCGDLGLEEGCDGCCEFISL